ncbi:MAG TPA: hypothetical protein DDW68_07705 [Verrucomicrobiales bacterium]|nr:hypothetical protein [Verrucomicrobiales bacterium]HBE97043.1 hypothetical protein [Verrucomicrobiales bacterium]
MISLVKKTLLAIVPSACLISCSNTGTDGPAAPAAAPYTAGNPYGVPGENLPNYDPNSAGYQPIAPINPSAIPGVAPAAPVTPVAPAAASTHVVVAGDSLWGLARQHNTTVEALQQANALPNTQINVGQTLNIPAAQ